MTGAINWFGKMTYAYQGWIDERISSFVPESKENIEISDRALATLGLLASPVVVPLALAGCELDETKKDDYEEDVYLPETGGDVKEDTEVPEQSASLGMCGCKTNSQHFSCLDGTCGTFFTPTMLTAKDLAGCFGKDISTSEPKQMTIEFDHKTSADTCYTDAELSVSVKGEKVDEFSLPCNSFGTSSLVFCVPAGTSLSDITLDLTTGDWCSSVLFTSIAVTDDPSCIPPCIDNDKDGYGENCELGDDCNDTNPKINSGKPEVCNNVDDDCDGKIDEKYDVGKSCTVGVGECENTGVNVCKSGAAECDVKPLPAQEEIACDGIDQDCDGKDFLGTDSDKDGYMLEGGLCGEPDCDDSNAKARPKMSSEVELGLANDGIDNNCDGYVDEIDVDGIELTLSDTSGYHDYIHIHNGGKIKLVEGQTSWETKDFTIEAGSVLGMSGVVCGKGDGSAGVGSADGGGGGGGSHVQPGGKGGNGGWAGTSGGAGKKYGSSSDAVVEGGSCGGSGGGNIPAPGGYGGGAISVKADNAFIYGAIYANGGDGMDASWDDGGAGGGSGGGIFISADNIYVDAETTTLSAKGGNGGNGGSYSVSGGGGGGGGAGGAIEFLLGTGTSPTFIDDMIAYGIIDGEGGLGGLPGCGSSKCGASGEDGEEATINADFY